MANRRRVSKLAALLLGAINIAPMGLSRLNAAGDEHKNPHVVRAALDNNAIKHIIVINLENESFADTFGPSSPATYLNGTLLKKGQLIQNYFATSHVSLGNYIAQVSGQAPTPAINNDCLDLSTLKPPFNLKGGFTDILPGIDAPDAVAFPGQVIGDGLSSPLRPQIRTARELSRTSSTRSSTQTIKPTLLPGACTRKTWAMI